MSKFLTKLKELANASELMQILPRQTVCDMYHIFTEQNNHHSSVAICALDDMITQQQSKIIQQPYYQQNSKNKVLVHGVLFNILFNLYIKHLNTVFDNPNLERNQSHDRRPLISREEFMTMPKRYRCVFIPYKKDKYVLNVPHNQFIFTFKKANKEKLGKLLKRAKTLIPLIYQTRSINTQTILTTSEFLSAIERPMFVADSLSANFVSDEQIKAIKELHDIFTEISKITFPRYFPNMHHAQSGAWEIYSEYRDEMTRKNCLSNALKESRVAAAHKKSQIHTIYMDFTNKKHKIQKQYLNKRNQIMSDLALQISTRVN